MCKVQSITMEDGQVFDIGGEYEFSDTGCDSSWEMLTLDALYVGAKKPYRGGGKGTSCPYKYIRHTPKPEPKFKVGERVRVTYKASRDARENNGTIAVVIDSGSYTEDSKIRELYGEYSYNIKVNDIEFFSGVHEDELEHYKPEMIDLPEGVYFHTGLGPFSKGLFFNKMEQVLSVDIEKGLYDVDTQSILYSELHKPDYCLIKSTRGECNKIGVLQVCYFGKEEDIHRYKSDISYWQIGLGENEYIFVNEKSADCFKTEEQGFNHYKLVKRSEVK